MKVGMLTGAACAALMSSSVPVFAATNPVLPKSLVANMSTDPAVSALYASRAGPYLWLRGGPDDAAAHELIEVLDRASLDGLPSGPALAQQARALIARGQAGDRAALASADRLLSTAWVLYVETLQTPPARMTYADPGVAPRRDGATQILARAAAARSLLAHVRSVSQVNPIYARLRDAAWNVIQASGGDLDPRVVANLDRARAMPSQDRYVMVDTAGARLYMIEDGRIVDTMRVIAGKADPSTQTPMLASTIYYATLNPYWHPSSEMVRTLIAQNVLGQGLGYLKIHGYEVFSAGGYSEPLDPTTVDWRAVADGRLSVNVRQLPGPGNSMGRMKIGFPNVADIYLHDTPNKELFGQQDRNLSHGCVRLEDAERLGRWLLGKQPETASNDPEQNVALPVPVPIYVTYLTAQVQNGQLSFVDDVYGRDSRSSSEVAALQ